MNIVFFAISVALAILSIILAFFAIYLSRAENKRAQELWTLITREVKGLSIRSENTERTTQRVFDNMMHALIAAHQTGKENVAKTFFNSKEYFSELINKSLSSNPSISKIERKRFVDEITDDVIGILESKITPTSDIRKIFLSENLEDIFNLSDNSEIAKRYVEFVVNNPGNISVESIRASNYEEYVSILDFLINENVLIVKDGFLNINSKFHDEIQYKFKKNESELR